MPVQFEHELLGGFFGGGGGIRIESQELAVLRRWVTG